MRVFVFISLFFICVLPAPVQAARFSGAYLYQLCQMDDDGNERVKGGHTACQAYIAGVIDYHTVLQSMKIAPKLDICVPEKTTSAQLHIIVLKYLEKNNTHDEFVAAPAITMALYEKFPCKT